ncbi:DnaJ domain-containing protein [Besnoitia besnoiti]|uniref:DnaJ domain-containing protein n=1 Tax=Besnoitia besnoiti TaxID=94643 RepID=A0A2A9MML4_BESBE|nr:DnaJ domain-containing protein [Besnoitia besnoiti]PFH38604.1 DnaJ domain-containing protein [Besnoitia besnoiti]
MATKKGKPGSAKGRQIQEKNLPPHADSSADETDAFGNGDSRAPGVFTVVGGRRAQRANQKKETKQQGAGARRADSESDDSDLDDSVAAARGETGGTGKRAGQVYDALLSGSQRKQSPAAGAHSGGEEARKKLGKKEKGKALLPRSGKRKGRDEGSSLVSSVKNIFVDSDSPLRSRLLRWLINICIAVAIIGVFALKAAEEYYGQDEDVSGQETEQHLAALQLESGATEADIRKAYRTLSVRWHPDKNPGCTGCQERFTDVAVAYEHLMKSLKKKKDEGAGEERGTGEGEEGLSRTSKDIIDFTGLPSDAAFYPATDRHVWTIMLHNDKDEFSEHVLEMWEETALTLGKYFKYGLINVRKNKDLAKRLPVNIKIFPAIVVMSNGMHPEVYPTITRPSVESIQSFIARSFPNQIASLSSPADVKSFLASSSSRPGLSALSQPYKLLVIPTRNSPASPALLLRHAAHKYLPLFSFGYLQNVKGILADSASREELFAILKDPPSWLSAAGETTGAQAKDAPLGFTADDLSTSLVFALFVDEGKGVRRFVETLKVKKWRSAQKALFGHLHNLLASFQQHVHPYLYQQNAALLCKGTLQQRVFTLVRVEGSVKNEESKGEDAVAEAVLSAEEVGTLLQQSRQRFLKEKAKDKPADKRKKEAEDEEEDEDGEEEEPTEEEDDEGNKDETFYIQPARLALSSAPALLPPLPGMPSSSPFFTFWKEELESSPLFLLDLEGSRVVPLQDSSFALERGEKRQKALEEEKQSQRQVLANLYQLLDTQQHKGEDEEFGETSMDFQPLPDYCNAVHFAKRCLASAAPSWFWTTLTGLFEFSWIRVLLLAAVAALYFFGGGLNSEMVIMLVLGGSLLIGGLEHFQTIFNFLTRRRH